MNTTITTWTAALLLAAAVPAQQDAASKLLARAKLLEQQEGDLAAAEQAYRQLLEGTSDTTVASEAALHLGELLWQLDKQDDARPFLQRAATAGGEVGQKAQAVLAGQDPQSQAAQARLADAQQLVRQLNEIVWRQHNATSKEAAATFDTARTTLTADLLRCGDAGAAVLVEQLDNVSKKDDVTTYYQDPDKLAFSALLWQFDVPAARDYLVKVAAQGPLEWQRFLTQPAKELRRVPAGMLPAVLALVQVADPAGIVQANLGQAADHLSLDALVGLISSQNGPARAYGFAELGNRWRNLDAAEQERLLAQIAPALPERMADNDPAWRLLAQFGERGPRAAQRLVLQRLAGPNPPLPQSAKVWPLDDADVQSLAEACRRAGPTTARDRSHQPLTHLLARHQPEWTAASLDALLDMIELGYATPQQPQFDWWERFLALATPTQTARLVRSLPKITRWQEVVRPLAETAISNEVATALVSMLDAALADPPEGWENFRYHQGHKQMSGPFAELVFTLTNARSASATRWLTHLIEREPCTTWRVAQWLIERRAGDQDEDRKACLRKILVWVPPPGLTDDRHRRCLVFAELARLGDVAAIDLYPRAYELGLEPTMNESKSGSQGRGVQFLGQQPNSPSEPLHGYSDAQLARAWQLLLDSPQQDEVWTDVRTMQDRVPVAALPLLAPRLPQQYATADRNTRNTIASLLWSFRRVTPEDLTRTPALRGAIGGLLRADEPLFAAHLLGQLQASVAAQFIEEARELLARSPQPAEIAVVIRRCGTELRTEDWLRALDDTRATARSEVLAQLPLPLDERLRDEIVRMLRSDADAKVRQVAATTLARLVAAEGVPALLSAMWDENEAVAKAAADALERIRFHQEQQAYWKNAKAGVDVSTASTSAKLLLQAKPDQPKAQRLLAIEALAALAAPAALPYLIEWSADQDAQIAAAAKSSLAAIVARNGAGRSEAGK